MPDVSPRTARRTWRALEAVHGMIYFTDHAPRAYAEIGITSRRMGYFASRAAAMGPVPAEVVIATFFNFEPGLVRRSIPDAWSIARPDVVLSARLAAVDVALRSAWGDDVAGPEVREAADLARRAALGACEQVSGRPLFAGHAALAWPDEPHLVLWHAQTLLREHRGDGHVALLCGAGWSGLEALVMHAASGEVPADVLRATRAWSEVAWDEAVSALVHQGLVTGEPLGLTEAGRAQRIEIESQTDLLAAAAYRPLGEDGCARLVELGSALSRRVVEAGLLHADVARLDDD